VELPHDERRQRPVGLEIGTEQDAAGLDSSKAQNVLEERWRNVQHRDRLAHERQRGGQALECFRLLRHRQVTCPSPRGRPQLGQVRRQPLLQVARPAGGHQCRPRPPTANIDEEAGTVGLRARAGKRRGRRPRSACRADRGDKDDPTVHLPAGLAKLLLVTTR
jgi:hypothetical protein